MKTSSFADPSQSSHRAVSRRLLGRFAATARAIIAGLTSATLVHALDGAPVPPTIIVETSANIPGIGIVVRGHPSNRVLGDTTTGADGTFAVKCLAPGKYDVSVGNDKPRTIEVGPDGNVSGKVKGDGNYSITTKKNSYVGHVTLLR